MSARTAHLATLLALVLSGGLGALPGAGGFAAEASTLTWLALWSASAGILAGAHLRGSSAWVPPLCWAVLLLASTGEAAGACLAAGACAALYAFGLALGAVAPDRAWGVSGAALLAAGLLAAAPSGGGALARPFPPVATARLLDLSPVAWIQECAGIDFMRHPSVYEVAGAGDLGPELRVAHRGAGSVLPPLGLALLSAVAARRRRSRRERA